MSTEQGNSSVVELSMVTKNNAEDGETEEGEEPFEQQHPKAMANLLKLMHTEKDKFYENPGTKKNKVTIFTTQYKKKAPKIFHSARPIQTKKKVREIPCEVCEIKCSSQAVLEGHFRGKKHLKNLNRLKMDKEKWHAAKLNIRENQQIAVIQPKLENLGKSEPVVGVEYITEYQNKDVKYHRYFCELCLNRTDAIGILEHVLTRKHRLRYMRVNWFVIYQKVTSHPNYDNIMKPSDVEKFLKDHSSYIVRSHKGEIGRCSVKPITSMGAFKINANKYKAWGETHPSQHTDLVKSETLLAKLETEERSKQTLTKQEMKNQNVDVSEMNVTKIKEKFGPSKPQILPSRGGNQEETGFRIKPLMEIKFSEQKAPSIPHSDLTLAKNKHSGKATQQSEPAIMQNEVDHARYFPAPRQIPLRISRGNDNINDVMHFDGLPLMQNTHDPAMDFSQPTQIPMHISDDNDPTVEIAHHGWQTSISNQFHPTGNFQPSQTASGISHVNDPMRGVAHHSQQTLESTFDPTGFSAVNYITDSSKFNRNDPKTADHSFYEAKSREMLAHAGATTPVAERNMHAVMKEAEFQKDEFDEHCNSHQPNTSYPRKRFVEAPSSPKHNLLSEPESVLLRNALLEEKRRSQSSYSRGVNPAPDIATEFGIAQETVLLKLEQQQQRLENALTKLEQSSGGDVMTRDEFVAREKLKRVLNNVHVERDRILTKISQSNAILSTPSKIFPISGQRDIIAKEFESASGSDILMTRKRRHRNEFEEVDYAKKGFHDIHITRSGRSQEKQSSKRSVEKSPMSSRLKDSHERQHMYELERCGNSNRSERRDDLAPGKHSNSSQELEERRRKVEDKIFDSLKRGSLAPLAKAFQSNPELQEVLKQWEKKHVHDEDSSSTSQGEESIRHVQHDRPLRRERSYDMWDRPERSLRQDQHSSSGKDFVPYARDSVGPKWSHRRSFHDHRSFHDNSRPSTHKSSDDFSRTYY